MNSIDAISLRVESIIRATLGLGDDVTLTPDSDLISEVGLDSIEAFEAVATLHDLLGVRVADDLDPKSIGSIRNIAMYITATCPPDVIDRFMNIDLKERLSHMRDSDELV